MNSINQVRQLCFTCVTLFVCLLPLNSGARQALDKIVAVVNSEAISGAELDNYTKMVTAEMRQRGEKTMPDKNSLQHQILNRMILDRIQLQLAEQAGIEVDSLTVSQTLQAIAKEQGQSVDNYKRDIEARGINFNEYRDVIKTDLIIQSLQSKEVAQDISVSKADIEGYLNSPAGQDNSGTEYRLSHILLPTPESPTPEALKKAQAQAEELVTKLKNGADFNKTAMSSSSGRQALRGGDLGWRSTGELPTLFVNQAPSMKVGDVVGPIRSASGFHIIKLQEKRIANEETRTDTRVRQILIKTDTSISDEEARDMLVALKEQIAKGADFAKLAEQKSQEARTAPKGGDMGWMSEKTVLPKFYQVMIKLRNNEVSEPFSTEEGWHLIQVLDRRSQRTSSEAAWNKASEILRIRKTNEALEAWMKRIRDDARVEILLPNTKTN